MTLSLLSIESATTNALNPLRVLEARVYRGPHLYSHTPMIRLQVDLGSLEEWPTNRLPGFTKKLIEQLPGLRQHTCSTGKVGGFVSRLEEGTWLGHVIEHVAIELQAMAGMLVARGKTRSVKGKPGCYNIMYAYRYEAAGLYAGRLALQLVASLLNPPFNQFMACDKVDELPEGPFNLQAGVEELKRIAKSEKLGPTTQSLVDEAERRNIPWTRLDDQSLIQLGTGRHQKLIRASVTGNTSYIAVETASDKDLTKNILTKASIPVPEGQLVRTLQGALETAQEVGFPLVIKPYNGNHGRGVTTDVHTLEEVKSAFQRAKKHARSILVEKHFIGRDYRVLVVNGEVAAVAERVPAHVIGNGQDTIEKLIEMVNADPRRGEGHEEVMTRITIDESVTHWLARSGFNLATIPTLGQHVVLAATANLSTGGTAVDRTDEIHPDNALIARRAALTIGLDVAGIDMILPDIRQSWREIGGGIIEVNAAPGFRMHLHPSEGRPRDVARPVIAGLFPAGAKTQIPVIGVTGTNGKSTTVRMVSHILRHSGLRVGFTSTSGIFVNDDCIWHGDASGPKSARLLMRDPTIDVAVLETARGGILREGLGVSDLDVGAVLNVTPDHLGIGGINTLEELAAVKSVITESVRPHGVSVLNADDPETLHMAKYADGSICYFSMHSADQEPLRMHIANGGMAVTREVFADRAQLVLHQDGARTVIMPVNKIPATCAGAAVFNIENALAAAAIVTGLGIEPCVIRSALASFVSSYEQNPGRFNVHDDHGFRIIMDYAHNPAALRAFFGMIREMRTHHLRVIGHVSTPGDRRDEDIREIGRIAGSELDIVVFREFPDNRGRPEGEIMQLLKEGALSVGCPEENIRCVYKETDATDECLNMARPGDLVILTPSDIETTWKQVTGFEPTFIESRPSPLQEQQVYYA